MEINRISQNLFIKNRSKLTSRLGEGGCAIVFSNDEMPRNGDQYFPYRQDSDFFYLTGVEQEKSILILSPFHPEKKLREVLLILKSSPLIETWTGHKLTKEEAKKISGIKNVEFIDSYESILGSIILSSKIVYLNIPEIPKFNPEIETRSTRLSNEVKKLYPLHHFERLAPLLRDLRTIKEEEEIEAIQESCSITARAFSRVLKIMQPDINEKIIEAEISYEFNKNGARHAYPPIIGAGKNACILHYTENNQLCKNGDLVLMDFGAEFNNYAADCSRTIPVSGKFTERQAKIYDGLHTIFKNAIGLMVPGQRMEDVHKKVCGWMKQYHIDLGLYTRGEAEKAPCGLTNLV